MKKRRRKQQKSSKKLLLLAILVLTVGIGFASLQKYLSINGTASIDSNFDVSFGQILKVDSTGTAYEKSEPTLTSTTATFDVGLMAPGDSLTYEITVDNYGQMNAKLDSIELNQIGSSNIKFEVLGMSEGDILHPQETKDIKVKVTYEDNNSYETNNEKEASVTLLFVQDSSDTYKVGDVITLADENFYVISDNGDTVTALAKYNLLVGKIVKNCYLDEESTFICERSDILNTEEGYGLQSEKATGGIGKSSTSEGVIGTIAFKEFGMDFKNTEDAFIYDNNSDLYPHVKKYENYLNSLEGINSVSATLLSVEQAKKLGCSFLGNCSASSYPWVDSVSYWLGSGYYSIDSLIYGVDKSYGNTATSAGVEDQFGLRPVITISKSELK